MTPGDVALLARRRYNAVNETRFFSDQELYGYLWAAQMDLAREAYAIEQLYTTSTVASQQEYSYPTNTIAIKRITYDGIKLHPFSFREDDSVTLSNAASTATGTPQYYAVWNETIYLRPIPAGVGTLKIFSYNEPQEVTNTSSLEVPTMYHLDLVEYLLWMMASKDKNFKAAEMHERQWTQKLSRARAYQRRRLRGDSFTAVQDFETLPTTVIGSV